MASIVDIFNGDAFSAVELTRAVNTVPNNYGRIGEIGVFPETYIPTTTVAVEVIDGELNLLPMRERGGPPSLGTRGRSSVRAFAVPHIPHDDIVVAADVQNRLSRFGEATGLEAVADHVNGKLLTMRRKHAITLEFMRAGALAGTVLDYDGSVVFNYFTEFGITEKTVDFDLGNAAANVAAKCREVTAHMEDHLNGDTMASVHALCAPDFFEALITHPSVESVYANYPADVNPLRQDVRRSFPFHGITFEEYRGSATQLAEDGTKTARRMVANGTARFFPLGTADTFENVFAPPDVLDLANTPANAQVYVDTAVDPEFGRWVKLHSQSNPLPLVKRPAMLVKGTLT